MLRLAWAFMKRDGRNVSPVAFLAGWMQVILSAVFWFFVARFIRQETLGVRAVLPVDYFTFGLVGLVLSQYIWRSFASFASRFKGLQASGTFETFWVTPPSFLLLVVLSGAWDFACATLYAVTLLVVGVGWLGAHLTLLQGLQVLGIGMGVAVSAACFALLVASYNLAWGSADGARNLLSRGMLLISGTFFPLNVLPVLLKSLALFLPITQGLLLARRSIWMNQPAAQGSGFMLVLLTGGLMGLAWIAWRKAVRMARVTGRMTLT